MAIFGSSEEQTLESNGEVNNNIILTDMAERHFPNLTYILLALLILRLIEVAYFVHKAYRNKLRKKYSPNNNS